MTRLLALLFALCLGAPLLAADGNRLTYLDEFCDPYYPHRQFARLTTPQWVGERDVECVVVLAIDDMRDVDTYEKYLRPILDRLKQIDGRAPVSIMTCQVDPRHGHLQQWLKEGVSLEVHTFNHPCPCLAGGDFAKSKGTFDKCVDLMHQVPGNKPVAFRMPCCDSLNTPSPRFWMEAFNQATPESHYLSIDTSVFNIITGQDEALPRELRYNQQGEERFRRYVPFKSFVNTIEDYPYPYVIGKLCWQFPCVVPSDWSAQHVQKPNNPDTVRDLKLALDACVAKQGVYNLVFHPHGWIRNDQVVELIDHAVTKHGKKVKFLNFRECDERLQKHLLAGQPLRDPQAFKSRLVGQDNGVRLLDVNADGYMDVVIGERTRRWSADQPAEVRAGVTRIWQPTSRSWKEVPFPETIDASGPRFGVLSKDAGASMLGRRGAVYHFQNDAWQEVSGVGLPKIRTQIDEVTSLVDYGVRLRDFDQDGICEAIDHEGRVARWDTEASAWRYVTKLPEGLTLASHHDDQERSYIDDMGLRFVDLHGDGDDDIVVANSKLQGVWLFESLAQGWQPVALPKGFEIPPIAREGRNNGAWIHSGHVWWQNEHTNRLPDHVDRRSFTSLLGKEPTAEKPATITPTDRTSAAGQEATSERIQAMGAAKSPADGLKSIVVPKGLRVELVASEPLIVDPVALDWGPDGRLWVVEMRDYPRGIDEHGKPGGRVKVLTDSDGDGKFDTAQLFLDDLPFPTGIKVWRKGVLITAAPDLIYAEDTNGDGRADVRKVLYRGFGEGNQQHRVNGLRWGLDGWLYLGNGDSGGKIESLQTKTSLDISGRDLRVWPDTGELEAVSGATQYSLCFDDFGARFGGNNSNPVWHYLVEDYYLKRNPHVKPPRTTRQISITPGNAPIFPLSKTVTRFNDYHTANRFTSACGIESYRDHYLGDAFYANSFVCEPVHNLVHREVVERDGASFRSRRAPGEEASEFLASTDNWFRPVMARTGPDGALYVVDMYRLVIEHPTWIPADWQQKLNLRAGDDKGRIYRVVRDDQPPRKLPRLDKLTTAQLVDELRSASGTRRDMAQQLLIWQADAAAADTTGNLVRKLAADRSEPAAVRVQAWWTVAGLGQLKVDDVVAMLSPSEDAEVACAAARLADGYFAGNEKLLPPFQTIASSQLAANPRVALACAHALGRWPGALAGQLLAQLARQHRGDELLLAATTSSLTDGPKLEAFFQDLDDSELQQRCEAATVQLARHLKVSTISAASWEDLADEAKWKSTAARYRRAAQLLASLRNAGAMTKLSEPAHKVVTQLTQRAGEVVIDIKQPLTERVAACRLLLLQDVWRTGETKSQADYTFAKSLLGDDAPPELRAELLAGVRASRSFPFDELLYKQWLDRTQTQRREILDTLAANDHARPKLLQLLDAKLLTPADIDATRAQLLRNHPDRQVREKAAALTKTITLSDRAELVDRYADVLKLIGDAASGRAVFRKRCTACHQLEGEGKAIGPDLASLTDKSSKALLTALLDPNRAVEAKFVEYLVITDDGQLVSGIVTSETGTSLTLQSADGKQHTLLRTEIEELRSNNKSLMPEGFERDMQKQEFADVIRYLQATVPPKKFAGNTPQVIHGQRGKAIELPAFAARFYGPTIVFEGQYQNAGYWQHPDDHVQWSLAVPAAGKYELVLDFACADDAAGNTLQLASGGQTLTFEVPGTGSWDNYRQTSIGVLTLEEGATELTIRSHGSVRHALLDLRALRIVPKD